MAASPAPVSAPESFLKLTQGRDSWHLALSGRWTIRFAMRIKPLLEELPTRASQPMVIDGRALERIDTAGVLLLKDFCTKRGILKNHIRLEGFDDDYATFLSTMWDTSITSCPQNVKIGWVRQLVESIGAFVVDTGRESGKLLTFAGRVFTGIAYLISHPRQFRLASMVHHMDQAGIRALPIVSLLAFLISIVLAYQGATQLRNFGADIFTVDLTVISILREMGVLLTAIIVAGRSGSAFAAEIGVMKLREEINALHTFGMNPYHILVIPRLLALTIMMPVLTFVADIMGLLGTAVMTYVLLDISFEQFIGRTAEILRLHTFVVGMVKAPVFGLLIGLIGTYQGMQVSGSAESVGRLTTTSVVQSVFLVILVDALFSILFSEFRI
jgi:phospholipid/cholesterol/gamma-HCH transport system permease protein